MLLRRAVLALAVALAVAGCGSGGADDVDTASVAPASGTPTDAPSTPDPVDLELDDQDLDGVAFASPSGNITCFLPGSDDGGPAGCQILEKSYENPSAPEDCMGDYGSTLILDAGRADVGCVGDAWSSLADVDSSYTAWYTPDAGETIDSPDGVSRVVTLSYGSALTYRGIRCESAESGVTCSEVDSDAGFLLSRSTYELYGQDSDDGGDYYGDY